MAFQIHLGIGKSGSYDEILPVLWDDNYFSLLPGESRTVTARYPDANLPSAAVLRVDGWNLQPIAQTVLKQSKSQHP